METPKTLQEAIQFYSNYENCMAYMVALRWPNGVTCPTCGSDHVVYMDSVRRWKCYSKHERPQFSLKTGTIFEDSPLGLDKWLPVMWLLANSKNGVSSWEIHRGLKVTQKTAWFMLQRARLAAQDPETGGKLGGEVEVDETFIGARARNMHKDVKERRLQGRTGGTEGKMFANLAPKARVKRIKNKLSRDEAVSMLMKWSSASISLFGAISAGGISMRFIGYVSDVSDIGFKLIQTNLPRDESATVGEMRISLNVAQELEATILDHEDQFCTRVTTLHIHFHGWISCVLSEHEWGAMLPEYRM